jgi:hypothetical protein
MKIYKIKLLGDAMQKGRRDFMGFMSALVAMVSFGTVSLGASTQIPAVAHIDSEADIYDHFYEEFDPDGWL